MTTRKSELRNLPYVNVPRFESVEKLLQTQKVSDTYFSRGSGQATDALNHAESTHRHWVSPMVDLSDFPYCYYVHGVTDAIHHWSLTEDRVWQILEGDYEYANMVGGKGTKVLNQPLYLSNPAAETGNIIHSHAKSPVILDCTYVSSTAIKTINIPENTEQVFFSFSKGFGLIGQRLGLVYTKEPHHTLHRLKEYENWNYGGVKTMQLIMNNFAIDSMFNKYRKMQLDVCTKYDLTPSDVFYLATTKDKYYIRRRRGGNLARICLTPLFDDVI